MNCPLTNKPCDKKKPFRILDLKHNEVVRVVNVCENCLQAIIKNTTPKQEINLEEMAKKFGDLINKVIKSMKSELNSENKIEKKCPGCGCTPSDIHKSGKMGCPQCYSSFNSDQIMMQLHGAVQHVGKIPKRYAAEKAAREKELQLQNIEIKVQKRLAEAIQNEEYEVAAMIKKALTELDDGQSQIEKLSLDVKAAIDAGEMDDASRIQKDMEAVMFRCFEIKESLLKL